MSSSDQVFLAIVTITNLMLTGITVALLMIVVKLYTEILKLREMTGRK